MLKLASAVGGQQCSPQRDFHAAGAVGAEAHSNSFSLFQNAKSFKYPARLLLVADHHTFSE
jgi:hypothetical protein